MPVIMPFVCAFISSFSVAFSLTFDSINLMSYNMCSIKEYSSTIKLLVSLILIHQMINRYSYGSKRGRWLVIGVYIFTLFLYGVIEMTSKPTNKYLNELKCDN